MSFFPADPSKHRPAKILFKVDVLREADRAVQEGIGGYSNRHELVNDLVEQGLIDLRYPQDERIRTSSEGDTAPAQSSPNPESTPEGSRNRRATVADGAPTTPEFKPLADIGSTRMVAPLKRGVVVENAIGSIPNEPLFGMHNRDAPSAWALSRLAAEASNGPVPLSSFYDSITTEAWTLATQLSEFETEYEMKLAVMLPRNAAKPQSASIGFQAFALGQVARKPDSAGLLTASGPFYQWGAVGLVGEPNEPHLGLTSAGWELLTALNGLAFALPHDGEIARKFLSYLRKHAPADAWGFLTALDGAELGLGRTGMIEHFHESLATDFSHTTWKQSVSESVASGYVSRARAWALLEPKLHDRKYRLTALGQQMKNEIASAALTS